MIILVLVCDFSFLCCSIYFYNIFLSFILISQLFFIWSSSQKEFQFVSVAMLQIDNKIIYLSIYVGLSFSNLLLLIFLFIIDFFSFLMPVFLLLNCVENPMVGVARILPPYFLHVVKGVLKGWSNESGKPLLCLVSYKRRGSEGREE